MLKRKRKLDDNDRDTRTITAATRTGAATPATTQLGPLRQRAHQLLDARKTLPIFFNADEIRKHLREKDVLLLVGETGSGKSTQVPQFLVDESWARPNPVSVPLNDGTRRRTTVGGCIAITEPRRVAAISLARRVAEEVGTPLGSSSPSSTVGYSVRFDNSTSPSTRIKYLTEGMLLQEMLSDPALKQYSAVIVDEVHERGVNVDLVLGFLRGLACERKAERGGIPLKVVVMSATADMEVIQTFFESDLPRAMPEPVSNGPNGSSEVALPNIHPHPAIAQKADESSDSEWSGISTDDEKTSTAQSLITKNGSDATSKRSSVAVCHIKGRQYPVQVIYTPSPVEDFVDAALQSIFQIHYKEPLPGDILVFLTGQETVENLEKLVHEYAMGLDKALPKVQVLPLFAALPQDAQQRVFSPAPPRTRKIILATNIAETSVTISGVRFVVDCGKAKMKHFRTRLGLDSLLVKPISKSAANQRKGRAGREAPGKCFRLYTEQDYLSLEPDNAPEILRCDLTQAILTMKARGIDEIFDFPFLTSPPRDALEKAMLQLLNLKALDETARITDLGVQIARLPLTASLGRVLLAAAAPELDCLLEIIDIISCLSVENIFLNLTSEEKKEEAENARRELFRREGDHLTMLATVQAYASENADRKAWAEKHFVSHRAMKAVMDVRKQLTAQCRQARLLDDSTANRPRPTDLVTPVLQSFLTGFAWNTARLMPDGSYKTVVGNQTVAIHPSSVLYGRKVEAIMYNEFVFTNRSYGRSVSAVQMKWIGDALGD